MIIDFHTHVFPEAIAKKTIELLASKANITPVQYGTVDELTKSMVRSGVDASVILPVVTAPRQFESINRFSASLNGKDGIISFGGIHPDNDNIKEKLLFIKELGMKGIKLHPDYQQTFVDDDKYAKIVETAIDLDLTVVFHAGVDVGYPSPVHCTPVRSRTLLKKVYGEALNIPSPKIVFAHMGGCDMYEDVMKSLCGLNIFFDTSYCLKDMPEETALGIIRSHGADRMLFATDSPWADSREFISVLESLPLTSDEKYAILGKNAEKLLKI